MVRNGGIWWPGRGTWVRSVTNEANLSGFYRVGKHLVRYTRVGSETACIRWSCTAYDIGRGFGGPGKGKIGQISVDSVAFIYRQFSIGRKLALQRSLN
jgi:hypothetical protein